MVDDDFITVRQLADRLDTTKNKVAYQVRKISSEHVKMINGIKYLSKHAQELVSKEIKQLESDELNTLNQGVSEADPNTKDAIVIEIQQRRVESLENQIAGLEEHLKTKDRQIDQLHTIIANQSQQLNMQLLEYEEGSKSWWRRLFSK